MKKFTSFHDCATEVLGFIRSRTNDSHRFNELAIELFHLQFENVVPYRKLCERTMRGRQPAHWTDIPTVPTSAFKDFELTCLPADQRTNVFYSSGTTEQRPSRHFHNEASLAVYEISLLQWFMTKFLKETGPNTFLISLTPSPALAPNSSLAHMFGTIAKSCNMLFTGDVGEDRSWIVDFKKTTRLLEMFCDGSQPFAIVGTAFGFVHLLDHLTGSYRKYKLPPGSRVMETGGYKGRSRVMSKAKLHQLLSEQFGLADSQIISEYGMSELSSQGYDNPDHIFRFPPWARVQIISPETKREVGIGETGLVRIYDLANVYSVMAIQTEDLAIRRDDGFELIGRANEAEPRGCSLMATEGSLH